MVDRFTQVVSIYGPKLITDFSFPVVGSCGFWGNFGRETGGFTAYQEDGSGSNSGGRSWAQWTGPRRVAFLAFCKAHGLDPKSDAAGYGFLCHELRGPYAGVVAAVKRASTLESAVRTVERLYEGAGVKAMAERVTWGRKALAILHPGHPALITPPAKPPVPRMRRKPIADKHRGHH